MSENEKQNGGNDETRERIERMRQNGASGKAEEAAAADVLMDKICQEIRRQQNRHDKQLGEVRRELEEQRERSNIVEDRQKQIEGRMHRMEREARPRPQMQEKVPQPQMESENSEPSSNRSLVLEIGAIVLVAAIAVGVYLWMGRDKDEGQQPQKPDAFWDLGGNGR